MAYLALRVLTRDRSTPLMLSEWGPDLACDELGDCFCDHPESWLLAVALSATYVRAYRAGTSTLRRLQRPRTRPPLPFLLHPPGGPESPEALQAVGAGGGVCGQVLQGNELPLPQTVRAQGGGKASPVHPVRKLAEAVHSGAEEKVPGPQAVPFDGPLCPLHAGTRQGDGARPAVHAEAGPLSPFRAWGGRFGVHARACSGHGGAAEN